MTYTVYGIRLQGEIGARYIGQTAKPIRQRLGTHVSEAKAYGAWNPTRFHAWIRENLGNIEVFQISAHDTREGSVAGEIAAIQIAIALGHDLLQRSHVVAARKLAPDRAAA